MTVVGSSMVAVLVHICIDIQNCILKLAAFMSKASTQLLLCRLHLNTVWIAKGASNYTWYSRFTL